MSAAPSLLEQMSVLAEPIRGRLLLVLEAHECSVSELCTVLQLPQSTVSRHLRLLSDEGWLTSRADGTSRHYRMAARTLPPELAQLWRLVRRELEGSRAAAQDAKRMGMVLARRREGSKAFFATAAGEWDRLRIELFGERAELLGLLGLLDPAWVVGDLGCGGGQVAAALAPFVTRVVAVDESPEMLEAARARLGLLPNVLVRRGALEALPLDDAQLDAAILSLVLHHVAEPAHVLHEAARVLRPGGRLLLVDMLPHDREEYRQAMGHAWLGFDEPQLAAWLLDAGFADVRYRPLMPDPRARGPGLFAAGAVRLAAR